MFKFIAVCLVTLFMPLGIAHALPMLQLDAEPGTYVLGSEESTVVSVPEFDLIALLDESKLPNWQEYSFFVSIALTPKFDDPGATKPDFGSFEFDGDTYDTVNMEWGTPPVDILAKNDDLPSHGIFNTLYSEIGISFDSSSFINPAYNVQTGATSPGSLLMSSYSIDLTQLSLPEGGGVHIDLYGYIEGNNMEESFVNAPFSKDVSTGVAPVPEPATMILFGTGLVGLVGSRLRKKKR